MKSLLSRPLAEYLARQCRPEAEVLQRIRRDTEAFPPHQAAMQIPPEQGQFLDFLVRLLDARAILEVGVFTGYSSTCMALAASEDCRLCACEINPDYARLAQGYWQQAGVQDRIELHLGPAAATLDTFLHQGRQFDLAFLDADKVGLERYYESCLRLVRPGGLIVVDNVLWSGLVADPQAVDPDTVAIRAFNERVAQDLRVDVVMLPLADGLTLLRPRG